MHWISLIIFLIYLQQVIRLETTLTRENIA